jgi:neutral ceramidase
MRKIKKRGNINYQQYRDSNLPSKQMILAIFVQLRLIVTIFFIFAGFQSFGQTFRAAVKKVEITPENSQHLRGYGARKSTGIHDKIFHRVVVLDDGTTKFILVSSDLCSISPSEYDDLAFRLNKEFGIPKENFWWSVTHTHSAPEVGPPGIGEVFLPERFNHKYDEQYAINTRQKIVEAISEAMTSLVPANISVGWGHSNANINRRARDKSGRTYLGLNPDLPVDRKIGVLSVEKLDKTPIAIIANYAMHGTVIGGNCTLISGDAPGIVADYVEKNTGSTMLYINGAAGNIAPIYSTQSGPERLKEFEPLLGDRILVAYNKLPAGTTDVKIKTGKIIVETPGRNELNWPEYLSNYVKKNNSNDSFVKLPVSFLQLTKDIIIWSAPLELFCEISNDIRNKSPFPYTFYYGYTNGSLGYLLTDNELKYKGYESTVTLFKSGAEVDLTNSVLGYIEGTLQITD